MLFSRCKILLSLISILILAWVSFSHFGNLFSQQTPVLVDKNLLFHINQNEHFLGNPEAPVVMIQYASFSCAYCASFANATMPMIKEKFIKPGKVLLVFRDIPTDSFAFKASMVAHCYAPEPSNNRFFEIFEKLYKTQDEWAFKKDFLETLLVFSEMGRESFKKCIEDRALEDMLLNSKRRAVETLGVSAIPSLIINDKLYKGHINTENLIRIIEEELATVSIEPIQHQE